MFHTKNYRELNRLFFMFVIPAVSSQLLSGIYTIVDGYFVGWGIGQGGLAAIGLSFPFSVIVTAIGAGIGVGGFPAGGLVNGLPQQGIPVIGNQYVMLFINSRFSALGQINLIHAFLKIDPDAGEEEQTAGEDEKDGSG